MTSRKRPEGFRPTAAYPPGPSGTRYQCVQCLYQCGNRGTAMKHEHDNTGHHTERVDWHDDDYWPYVNQIKQEQADEMVPGTHESWCVVGCGAIARRGNLTCVALACLATVLFAGGVLPSPEVATFLAWRKRLLPRVVMSA